MTGPYHLRRTDREITDTAQIASILERGRMHIVTADDEKLRAMHALVNHLESDPAAYWSSRSWKLEDRLKGFSALVFEIESVTAKQGS